jgi:hypothetical protein
MKILSAAVLAVTLSAVAASAATPPAAVAPPRCGCPRVAYHHPVRPVLRRHIAWRRVHERISAEIFYPPAPPPPPALPPAYGPVVYSGRYEGPFWPGYARYPQPWPGRWDRYHHREHDWRDGRWR